MQPLFRELEKILQKQKEILEQSVQEARRQHAALRNNDQGGISISVQRQTGLTAQMGLLEQERQNLLVQLEVNLGLHQGVRLQDILKYAPAQVKKNLQHLAGQIRRAAGQLAEVNRYNRDLTGQALRFTNFMIKTIQPGGQTYNHSGKVQQLGKQNLINKSI